MKRDITILGSTGSIGTQTLEVISELESSRDHEFNVIALACGSNLQLLDEQVGRFEPELVCVKNEELQGKALTQLPDSTRVLSGPDGLKEIAALPATDLLVNALVGFIGLEPTLAGIRAGKKILLANKESLVVGGELVERELEKGSATILPIDSEHNAIFQALQAGQSDEVKRLIITASGGPFLDTPIKEIADATPEEALNHPNWDMGNRITCDSATMVNKGLEVIEAHWLFGLPYERIDAVIHPQSFVHSLVEYRDGSIIAEMGDPDMRVPIQYTLTYPDRYPNDYHKSTLAEVRRLDFRELEEERYPAFKAVVEAGEAGGNRPAAVNGADEALIKLFLDEKIRFGDIATGLNLILDAVSPVEEPTLKDLRETDEWARNSVNRFYEEGKIGFPRGEEL
ncbi:MAG: 1-deoxy-D-xylulose-5-phosphate reductoisomerase [Candidatus Acetothermia bacterium]